MADSLVSSGESPMVRRRGRPLGSRNGDKAALVSAESQGEQAEGVAPRRGRPRKESVPEAAVSESASAAVAPQPVQASSVAPAGRMPMRRAIGFRTGGRVGLGLASSTGGTAVQEPVAAPVVERTAPVVERTARVASQEDGGNTASSQQTGGGARQNGGYYGNGQGGGYRQQRQQFANGRNDGRNDGNGGARWRDNRKQQRQQGGYVNRRQEEMEYDDSAYVGSESDYEGRFVFDLLEFQSFGISSLVQYAQEMNLENASSLNRHDLLMELVRQACQNQNAILRGGGVLEVMPDGNGFLRSQYNNYLPGPDDINLNGQQIRRWGLRTGDMVVGQVRPPRDRDRFFVMTRIDSINDEAPERRREVVPFENLVPDFPTKRIILEHDQNEMTSRVIDIITPIGRGQRGLIVAAPRTGKTIVMQRIANSILKNDPDIKLIVLLIDERPEEVTDMKRMVKAEVVSSTFDESPDRHVQVAEMVIEKARRMVEYGQHVVILLDSITRLARAYNTVEPHSGRILTGGVDANALSRPKRFFGSARNIENGGSLTILATALVDTGSRMDDLIFEEFKGTGNMELNLDRTLSDRRIYPAVNVEKSGTRREELIINEEELQVLWALRKFMLEHSPQEAMASLVGKLRNYKSNLLFMMEWFKKEKALDGTTMR